MRIETYESKDGWRVRLRGENGEIIATTEAYDSRFNADRSAKAIEDQINPPDSPVSPDQLPAA